LYMANRAMSFFLPNYARTNGELSA